MIKKGKAVVCSIGLGYVDMPLANAFVIENNMPLANAFVIENKQISVNPC
jgi:UDP-N-acetyl-D-mannosaminuronate dehydrogenase